MKCRKMYLNITGKLRSGTGLSGLLCSRFGSGSAMPPSKGLEWPLSGNLCSVYLLMISKIEVVPCSDLTLCNPGCKYVLYLLMISHIEVVPCSDLTLCNPGSKYASGKKILYLIPQPFTRAIR